MCCDRRSEDINCTCSCACLDQSYRKQRPSPRRRLAGEERCRHRNVEVRGKGKGCRPHLMGPMNSVASAAAAYTDLAALPADPQQSQPLGSQLLCCSLLRQIHRNYENLQHVCTATTRVHSVTMYHNASFFENPKLFRSASTYFVSSTLLFRYLFENTGDLVNKMRLLCIKCFPNLHWVS